MVKSKIPFELNNQFESYALGHPEGVEQYVPSAYSTAWVARLRNEFGEALFPLAVLWLQANQNVDGSWGSQKPGPTYYSDRIVNTLTAVIALKEWSDRGMFGFEGQIESGMAYLEDHFKDMEKDHCFPFGFTVVVPRLYEEANLLSLFLPNQEATLMRLAKLRKAKMQRYRVETPFQKQVSLLYTLEGLSPLSIDWGKALALQNQEGGYLASPAAAAYTYMHTGDEGSLVYLQNIWNDYGFIPDVTLS